MLHGHFIKSTSLDGSEPVAAGSQVAIESFEAIYELLRENSGIATANLLAEPLITFGNGAVPTSISWYSAYEGDAVPIDSLDPARREVAKSLLKARIDAVLAAAARGPNGHLLAAALYIRRPSDVYFIGNQVVLTNWGLVDKGALATESRRRAAMASGLGGLGVSVAAPPIAAAEFDGWAAGLQSVQSGVPDRAQSQGARLTDATTSIMGGTPAEVADRAQNEQIEQTSARSIWLPPLVASIVAAAILLVLLIPGVLLYSEPAPVSEITQQVEVLRAGNEALEERLAALRAGRESGVCTADGHYELPPSLRPLADPQPNGDPAQMPPAQGASRTSVEPLLAPPLDQLVPWEQGSAGGSGNLIDHIDSGTVLVLAPIDSGVSVGTGFFVNDEMIVTNDHVIRDADPSKLFVVSRSLGKVVPVEIVARTNTQEPGDMDFVALTGTFDNVTPLTVSTAIARLNHVVAAGFPMIVHEDDAKFRSLIGSGDASEAPEASTTRGVVTALYDNTKGVPVIAHDAEISRGNSGGPLLDLCGRVVGVNTFTSLDRETNAMARYSLSSSALASFLSENGIEATVTAAACEPNIASAPQDVPSMADPLPEMAEEAVILEDESTDAPPATVSNSEPTPDAAPIDSDVESLPADDEQVVDGTGPARAEDSAATDEPVTSSAPVVALDPAAAPGMRDAGDGDNLPPGAFVDERLDPQ